MGVFLRKTGPGSTGPESPVMSVDVVLHPSAARTVTGTGPSVVAEGDTLRLTSTVTAIAGAGASLTVTVETSEDGAAWTGVPAVGTAMPAQTAVGSARRVYVGLDRYVRVVYTIAGTTPSVTFEAKGEVV